MILTHTRTWALALPLACLHCTSADQAPPAPSPDAAPTRSEATERPEAFELRGTIELRPLADDSELALTLAKGPLPAGVQARLENYGSEPKTGVAFTADDLSTLQAWSRELETQRLPQMRIAFEKTAATQPTSLSRPLHKGWQLHLVRTDDGFVVHDATGTLTADQYTAQPQVQVDLTPEDGQRFADLSERMVDRKLAIILDDRVISAPLVRERIDGGTFIITLGSTDGGPQEARSLVAKLAGVPISEVVLPTSDE
ncbi:MAG: hypothetical protein AB1Z98_19600 [Nannocystaceae bacterium]